ncbi:MAG: hypothetical protein IJQ21_05940 [Lachnospiraceae bacterium]|nr:hypothetical protein [Lachnospiraceae bacterium]
MKSGNRNGIRIAVIVAVVCVVLAAVIAGAVVIVGGKNRDAAKGTSDVLETGGRKQSRKGREADTAGEADTAKVADTAGETDTGAFLMTDDGEDVPPGTTPASGRLEIPFDSAWRGTYEITDFQGASQPMLWDGIPAPLAGPAVGLFAMNGTDRMVGIMIANVNDPNAIAPFFVCTADVLPDGSLVPVVDKYVRIEDALIYNRKITEEEAEQYVIYRDSTGIRFELDYDDGAVTFHASFLLTEEEQPLY